MTEVESQDAAPGGAHKGIKRLDTLSKLNAKPGWVNDDLYRLMYRDDLYIVAYERIKSKPGNMTPGADRETLDGFSMSRIQRIIKEMKEGTFEFTRARRVHIPKSNGKTRPLGIASPTDKVVQEVLRMILEAIYDSPYGSSFSEHSHGFRPKRGTHTALKEVRAHWSGVSWIVEGDIKGCFDNIDHDNLMNTLRKRISDERFLGVIWKALRCGYLEFQTPRNSIIGTPQGSIVSPILANIFLDQFDWFVQREIVDQYQKGEKRRASKEYRRISSALLWQRKLLAKAGDEAERLEILRRIRGLKTEQLSVNAYERHDTEFVRVKFVRYADDWMIGVNGPKALAEEIKNRCADFLSSIKLTLSVEKTHIRHAKTEEAIFLGTRIKIGSESPRFSKVEHHGNVVGKRTAGWTPKMLAPVLEIIRRLHNQGFCDANGFPKRNTALIAEDDDNIIRLLSSVLRGYLNYYSFADNYAELSRVQYVLVFSCIKTLAGKHRLESVRKAFRKYGNPPRVVIQREGKPSLTVAMFKETDWKARPTRFLINGDGSGPDGIIALRTSRRTRSKLGTWCVICGETEGVEMHHIRHIRKMGAKVKGFARLMASINRKQVPLCRPHHVAVHAGTYDGIGLNDLFDKGLAKA